MARTSYLYIIRWNKISALYVLHQQAWLDFYRATWNNNIRVAPLGHISLTPESISLCFCSSMSCTSCRSSKWSLWFDSTGDITYNLPYYRHRELLCMIKSQDRECRGRICQYSSYLINIHFLIHCTRFLLALLLYHVTCDYFYSMTYTCDGAILTPSKNKMAVFIACISKSMICHVQIAIICSVQVLSK